jgi:hypothetical protein
MTLVEWDIVKHMQGEESPVIESGAIAFIINDSDRFVISEVDGKIQILKTHGGIDRISIEPMSANMISIS